jgi:multiple sugar transport system substrate-binding protein
MKLKRTLLTGSLLFVLALPACTGFSIQKILTQDIQSNQPLEATPVAQKPTLIPTLLPPQPTQASSQLITIWVPPVFNPDDGSKAGNLLKERLNKFIEENPGTQIQVRVKNENGPGGLLDTLSTASAAAPMAIPSLIFLPRSDFENAALKGLLYPITGLVKNFNNSDWYPYAQQLSIIQGEIYGLPFAGDASILLYRPEKLGYPNPNWNSIYRFGQVVLFPAADPQALFTLALYQSIGGTVTNDKGQPSLNPEILKRVFSFYVNGAKQGLFPFWITQFETDEQTLQAYKEMKSNMVLTWISNYLRSLPADTLAMPIPPYDTKGYTQANGWILALSDPAPEHRPTSMKLAEFLVQSEFLSHWTATAGLLPTRPSELNAWNNKSIQILVDQVALTANILPTNDILTDIGPVLQEATIQVIKLQVDPSAAAESAASKLTPVQP